VVRIHIRAITLALLKVTACSTFLLTICHAQQHPSCPSSSREASANDAPSLSAAQTHSSQATLCIRSDVVTQSTDPNNRTYTINASTSLVILDVVVSDAKGNIVRGLKRDNFQIAEDDVPQSMVNFEVGGQRVLDPNLTIHSTSDLDRFAPNADVNIILLDEFNTRFEDMSFARFSLIKYFEGQQKKLETPTMLIAVDLQHFMVLQDFSQDKEELLSALERHFGQFPWQVKQGVRLAERYATAFGTLKGVAEAVIGHPGHKNMIWIGRGFPPVNLANMPVGAEDEIDRAVHECVNLLRDARVTLYTIDPAGVLADRGAYGDTDPDEYSNNATLPVPFVGSYQFASLAKATGGRALYGRNDIEASIGTAIRDSSGFYTLTYRPTNQSSDSERFRQIKVAVKPSGLTATARKGYYPRIKLEPIDPSNPSAQLTFDLLVAESSAMVYDGVPVSLVPSTTDIDSFTVHVDASSLTWTEATGTDPRRAEIVLLVATFDRKGRELNRDARVMSVKAPTTVPPQGKLERSLDIRYTIRRDSRVAKVRFVVRVAASGRIGTAEAALNRGK
jgi:VWFA-related protein